jgi:LysR family transcriptional activator of mexEF-oprN operon
MSIDHANLARLDLNLLVAFDALLSERHVTRAARRIGIGQSAMSHNLRRLRQLFGDDILARSGSEMAPTPRATELAERVRAVLTELQSTVLSARAFDPGTARRDFAIGMSPSLEIAIALGRLAAVHAEATDVRLSLWTEAPEAMLRTLDVGRMDLALGAFTGGEAHHKRRLLCEAEGYLCLYRPMRAAIG